MREPAQHNLRNRLAVFLANRTQQFVPEEIILSFGERPPRLHLHAILFQKSLRLNLLMKRVRLNLVDGRLHAVVDDEIHHAVGLEIGDTDSPDFARFVQFFQCAPRTENVAVGLVDKVQVEVVEAEAFEGFGEGHLCAFVARILHPKLCGDEELFSGHSALSDCIAYCFFIHVGRGCVYQPVAGLDSIRDCALTRCRIRHLIDAEAEDGHFYAVVQHDCFHSARLFFGNAKLLRSWPGILTWITVSPTNFTDAGLQTVPSMDKRNTFGESRKDMNKKKVEHIETIHEYNALAGLETLHPLVSVIDFSTIAPPDAEARKEKMQHFTLGFYAVFFKNNEQCKIRYGRASYDYQEGTLVFTAPGQVMGISDYAQDYKPSGHALLFHPDLIRGTSLAQSMNDYSFFSYDAREALHVSERERSLVFECFGKIEHELRHGIDKHSKRLIVSNIELFLAYCVRFYDRQFIMREVVNSGILETFERLVADYFNSEKPLEMGVPSVAHFAGELHLSANYFGDLIKKQTGKTALEYIHAKLLDVAKERMLDPAKSVSAVAYELGFKYPQHFTRFFKQHIGATPNEYRGSLN